MLAGEKMTVSDDIKRLAREALQRCDVLAGLTEEPGRITRTFLSPPMRDVHRTVGEWMSAAGMEVRVDGLGNIVGRWPGPAPSARALLIGSHLDTVPNAGRYDGILGVMLGIAVVEALRDRGLPIGVELVGFSEEEGVRFRTPYLGSKAFVGRLEPELLDLTGADGRSAREVAKAFGCSGEASDFNPDGYLGYLEAHIEQGPVLESLGKPLAVVTGIVGQSRVSVTITGRAAHAGTTPMDLRQDALVAAAHFVTQVNEFARQEPGLVATVGRFHVAPNASNVVPGEVQLSVDVRHADDKVRKQAAGRMIFDRTVLPGVTGCTFASKLDGSFPTVPMDGRLTNLLAVACESIGAPAHHMASGAGHDAAVVAAVLPSCMLFLRSPGGVSHHPDEAVIPEDVELGLAAMVEFVRQLAAEYHAAQTAR